MKPEKVFCLYRFHTQSVESTVLSSQLRGFLKRVALQYQGESYYTLEVYQQRLNCFLFGCTGASCTTTTVNVAESRCLHGKNVHEFLEEGWKIEKKIYHTCIYFFLLIKRHYIRM